VRALDGNRRGEAGQHQSKDWGICADWQQRTCRIASFDVRASCNKLEDQVFAAVEACHVQSCAFLLRNQAGALKSHKVRGQCSW
jgi:hypothetical protein